VRREVRDFLENEWAQVGYAIFKVTGGRGTWVARALEVGGDGRG